MTRLRFKPDLDNTPLNFGKYKGKSPGDVAEDDPQYIVWLYENIDPKVCTNALYRACQNHDEDEYWDENQPPRELDDDLYWR